MLGRRRFLGGALGLAGGALPAAGVIGGEAAIGERFRAVPKHLQVFRTPAAEWPAVVALCRKLGIATLAVAIFPAERKQLLADAAAAKRAFEPLARSGLAVRCMVGEGAWSRSQSGALPAPVAELLALRDRAFRFEALLLDVEPQVLPEWKRGERAPLVRGAYRLFEAARAACAGRGMKLAAALAPWYTRTPDPDKPGATFLDGCLDRLDEALLMAYRNEPGAAIEFAREALAALGRRPMPYWFGLTTQGNDAPGSTYYSQAGRFVADVPDLYARLKAGPAGAGMAGIAIHQYATLRRLVET